MVEEEGYRVKGGKSGAKSSTCFVLVSPMADTITEKLQSEYFFSNDDNVSDLLHEQLASMAVWRSFFPSLFTFLEL